MPHWFTFWKFIFEFSITGKTHSFPWPKDLNEVYVNLLKFFTFPSLKPKQFGGIAHVSGFKSEWHENFDGFLRQYAGFCRTQKQKLPSLVISRPVRFVCVKNTSSSDVLRRPTWEAWAPELECLGARRAPRKFYSGDQLWGLGALTKMLGSLKGSLKFSLEHSLVHQSLTTTVVQIVWLSKSTLSPDEDLQCAVETSQSISKWQSRDKW